MGKFWSPISNFRGTMAKLSTDILLPFKPFGVLGDDVMAALLPL